MTPNQTSFKTTRSFAAALFSSTVCALSLQFLTRRSSHDTHIPFECWANEINKKECKLVARHSAIEQFNFVYFSSIFYASYVQLGFVFGREKKEGKSTMYALHTMQCTMMIESFLEEKYDANGRRMQNRSQRFLCIVEYDDDVDDDKYVA